MNHLIDFQDETFAADSIDRVSAVMSEGPSHGFSVDLRGGQSIFFPFETEAKARTGRENFVALWKLGVVEECEEQFTPGVHSVQKRPSPNWAGEYQYRVISVVHIGNWVSRQKGDTEDQAVLKAWKEYLLTKCKTSTTK